MVKISGVVMTTLTTPAPTALLENVQHGAFQQYYLSAFFVLREENKNVYNVVL